MLIICGKSFSVIVDSLLIVIEFASGGRLLSHLRRQVDGLPWLQRINYGIQIAKGMEYLTSRNVRCMLNLLTAM